MKTATLFLCMILFTAGAALGQSKGGPSVAGIQVDKAARDVIWSDPPDYEGLCMMSEVIGLDYVTEVANDFLIEEGVTVACVRWWGCYWDGEPYVIPGFILRLYNNAGCLPVDNPFLEVFVDIGDCEETEFGWHEEVQIFSYQTTVDWSLTPDLYWFSVQAGQHPFPPHWGRLASESIQSCESAFKSEIFSYPAWVPASEAGGHYYDASQEFDDEPCHEVPPPPGNDICEHAVANGFHLQRCAAEQRIEGSTSSYNDDYDPNDAPASCTGYAAQGKDVVYYIDLQAGDVLDLVYNNINHDSSFYIVTDCSDMASCVVGADFTVWPDPEQIHYQVEDAGRYYLILDTWSANAGGPFTLDYMITCPVPEACCYEGGTCVMTTEEDCLMTGGIPQGEGTTCDPNPCGPPTGACCVCPLDCYVLTEEECMQMEGWYVWLPNEGCEPNPCPPVAVSTESWGSIKATYRE